MKKILLLILALLSVAPGFADVDLKTGDFHITYKDVDLSELKGASIERMYNSASRTVGLFGYGWTSIYETRLYTIGDGNILVREMGSSCATCAANGSGNASILIREKGFFELFFTPASPDQARIDKTVGQIIQMLIRDRRLDNTPVEIAKKRRELVGSMSQRAAEWVTYTDKGWLSAEAPAMNSKWFSTNGELQNIVLTDKGFTRNYNNKSYETFDPNGMLLSKHEYTGKLEYKISYVNGKVSQIVDGMNNIFKFQLNDKGLVTSIQVNNQKASYQYNDQNMLISSKDADKLTKTYSYNSIKALIGIKDEEKETTVEYDPRTGRVSRLKDNDSEQYDHINRKYSYQKLLREDGSVDPYRFATTVIELDGDDAVEDSTYNEYELKEILGRPYTYRTVIKDEYSTTETVFTECGCGPLSIKKNSKYANFKYDGKSRMIEKDNNEYLITATYDENVSKINRVDRKEKYSGLTETTEFSYSPEGDLIQARRDTMVINLAYDDKRKIIKMTAQDKVLHFKYNAINKPSEIRLENVGTIVVTYDDKGVIKEVKSEAGSNMALQVTQAFQELLSISKPQGLDYRLD